MAIIVPGHFLDVYTDVQLRYCYLIWTVITPIKPKYCRTIILTPCNLHWQIWLSRGKFLHSVLALHCSYRIYEDESSYADSLWSAMAKL